MVFLHSIALTQFRNFSRGNFQFDAPVIGIAGLNGVGKTNLLDAIYYLCYTKSYFQSREINNVQTGANGYRIEGLLQGRNVPGGEVEERISCIWKEGKKIIQHNNIAYDKVTEHIGKYTAVMIAPDDIALINEGSELRRKYVDGLLAQSDTRYLDYLLSYQKYLLQRNAYLRQTPAAGINHDLLDIYDARLAVNGAFLIAEREKLSGIIPAWIQQFYSRLSNGAEVIDVQYKKCTEPDQLEQLLKQSRRQDIEYRRTLCGPHTEDWIFNVAGRRARSYASQGQKKSFLIALKLAHIQWLQHIGKEPFLLLDDIFEKLDNRRLSALFEVLQQFALPQIFMTHTSKEDLQVLVGGHYSDIQIIELTDGIR